MREFVWALAVIVVLDALVVVTVVAFFRRDRVAGVMSLPYLAWLLYATALNGALRWLNGASGGRSAGTTGAAWGR